MSSSRPEVTFRCDQCAKVAVASEKPEGWVSLFLCGERQEPSKGWMGQRSLSGMTCSTSCLVIVLRRLADALENES